MPPRCRRPVQRAAGTAVFPLSMVHYSETLKITSVRHRSDLARLMEELSGFTVLSARRLTALYELDAAVTAALGIPASTLPATDLLGRGFGWAQGIRAAGRLVTLDGSDGTGLLRERLGTGIADGLLAAFDLFTEQMMLRGPSDADLPGLRALGYDPAAIVQAAQDRADNEAAFGRLLPDHVRRHPTSLLDRVLARELNTLDLVRAWKDLADAYGMGVFDALPEADPAAARTLTRSMPGAEVAAVLKTAAPQLRPDVGQQRHLRHRRAHRGRAVLRRRRDGQGAGPRADRHPAGRPDGHRDHALSHRTPGLPLTWPGWTDVGA
jgi:hypothetical protein